MMLLKVLSASLALLLSIQFVYERIEKLPFGKHILKDTYEYIKSFTKASSFKNVKLLRDPPHQKYIVIRKKELKELKDLFDEFPNGDNIVNVVYVLGLPGSGKTELARQYGNFSYEKYGVSTVITLNTESNKEFRQNLVNALIEIKSSEVTFEQMDSAVRLWSDAVTETSFLMNELRRLLRKRPGWLLIVDNIRDPNITQMELYKELPWPGTDQWGTGKMLVTTQVPLTCRSDRNSKHIRTKTTNAGLTQDDATTFLCGLVTTDERNLHVCDDKVAKDIVSELELLPLSIFAAGVYIARSMSMKFNGLSYSLDDYLLELKSEFKRLGIPHAHDSKLAHSGYPHTMLAALQLTIEKTIKINSTQLPVNAFLDFIALIGFSAELGTISSLHVENYIKSKGHDQQYFLSLINFPLVDYWKEGKCFRAHQVVRHTFRKVLLELSKTYLSMTLQSISHYFATEYKNKDKREIVFMFQSFFKNLPSQYCQLNCCLFSLERNVKDVISLVFKSFKVSWPFPHCLVLDTFLIQLYNIRLDNRNGVTPLIMFKGYNILYTCYKIAGRREEKNMVAARAIDVIKEMAPGHSELYTQHVSNLLLTHKSVVSIKALSKRVFGFFLSSKNISASGSDTIELNVRDIREFVVFLRKLYLSLSELYKFFIPCRLSERTKVERTRKRLISIVNKYSFEVHIQSMATMAWSVINFDRDDKIIYYQNISAHEYSMRHIRWVARKTFKINVNACNFFL